MKLLPSSASKLAGADTLDTLPSAPGNDDMASLPMRTSSRPELPLIEADIGVDAADMSDATMVALARRCFEASDDYLGAAHRNRWMDAMSRFRSLHPKGSKYWSDAYSRRSRLFRPKTRATVRKREAAAATAMFSTSDIVTIKPLPSDAGAAADARIQEALLNHHLTTDSRWYTFVVGTVQDADRQGIVCACTEWEYAESTRYYDTFGEDGARQKLKAQVPMMDRPNFRLIPVENLRFAPGCSWVNPVETSPYLIELRPMFVCDIRRNMANPRARLKYRDLSSAQLMSAGSLDAWDPIRIQREGNVLDRYSKMSDISDYTIVWVHRNIMRIDGEDYVYDTIGTSLMLSEVQPLAVIDPRGYRPYVIGSAMVESHNPYPEGAVTLMGPLQDAIDTMANLRVDATQMATAGRMFVKRSAGVDLNRLARFSPGATVAVDDPASIKWDKPPEPPKSNADENNLLNIELDDLIGNFNQNSVAANKQLNETVGGMAMLGDVGSQLTEYDLRTLGKTFYEPVLRQVLDLIKLYETSNTLAMQIGAKLGASEAQYWQALGTPTTLEVDVGFGATNPMKRLEKLNLGLKTIGEFFPYLMMMADQAEITAEVFGVCGYPDATRFFPFLDEKSQQDPKYRALIMQLNQMRMLSFPHIAEAQGRQQQGQAQAQGAIQSATIRAQSALQVARENNAAKERIRQMELALARVELAMEQQRNQMARDELMMKREQLASQIAQEQQTMAIQAETAKYFNPGQGLPLPPVGPEWQGVIGKLLQPGSGDTPVGSLQQDAGESADVGGPAVTGADMAKFLGPYPPAPPALTADEPEQEEIGAP